VLDVLGFLASLAIALTSVAFSHYIAQKIKFRSNFRGLVAELNYNLKVLADIRELLGLDEEAEKGSKLVVTTFPRLSRVAFDYFVIEGYLPKLPEEVREKLLEIYRAFDMINWYLDHYNETKYGVLFVTTGAGEIRRIIREAIKTLTSHTEQAIKDFLETYVNKV